MRKKVDVIVVNWNSGKLTMQAVAPYLNYDSPIISCNVIVVDNASTDNSCELFNNKIKNVIYNSTNVGFGKACNQAFKGSNADYILLLNPDTISEPCVLERLVEFLEETPNYGVTGPRQIDEKGKTLKTCGRFPTFRTSLFELFGLSKLFPKIFTPAPLMMDWDHSESSEVDHVMGSYMLIRKSVLDEVGFMDEKYFVFLEDIDLSKRISNQKIKIFYNYSLYIFHEGGGTGHKMKARRLFYSLSARSIYWRKHFGRFQGNILIIISFLAEPFLRIIDSLIKERKSNFKVISKAYVLYFKSLLIPA
ncbi:MAG: glycosyltransferase family 2 protein [Bacteroidota bacterium]|nr:glycosyltransferase family 2 protein [Bacteroidota bacterium]